MLSLSWIILSAFDSWGHTLTASFSPVPTYVSPIGACHREGGTNERWREDGGVKVVPGPGFPTVTVCVCVCLRLLEWSATLFICMCACVQFDSILVCQGNVSPESNSMLSLPSEVSECCLLQTKWWHPVCDSERPHRFTLDREGAALALKFKCCTRVGKRSDWQFDDTWPLGQKLTTGKSEARFELGSRQYDDRQEEKNHLIWQLLFLTLSVTMTFKGIQTVFCKMFICILATVVKHSPPGTSRFTTELVTVKLLHYK